jgi:prolyl-tRNA editing enzyme YbaK/EbsC (Cys-tRNA(Pro) deacylase)
MDGWNVEHVQRALEAVASEIRITFFESSTATSQMAADNIGCELGQIAKSIVFWVEERPAVVIISGDQRVDDRKLATLHNISRKKIRAVTAEDCISITGYAPGGVPPIAHRRDDILVYVDESLARYNIIYAAAGAHNAIMPMPFDQLVSLSRGIRADLKRDVDTPSIS